MAPPERRQNTEEKKEDKSTMSTGLTSTSAPASNNQAVPTKCPDPTWDNSQGVMVTPSCTLIPTSTDETNCPKPTWDATQQKNVTPPCTPSPTAGATSPGTTNPAQTTGLVNVPATSPAQPLNGDEGNNGLSGGAVAGIAIGCLIAGAAIAAIVLLLLFRRRRNKQASGFVQNHLPYNAAHAGAEKVPIVTANAVVNSIDNLIPQPIDDETITKEVSRLRDNIKNHVRTYYRFDPVGVVDIPHIHLTGLAAATGVSADVLAESLLNPAKRDAALRLYIAWVILSRCEGNRLPSLLPTGLDVLAVAVPNAQSALYSKWKTITGTLLQQYSQEPSVHSQNIADAIAELNTVVAPFVQGSVDGGQRNRNLEMILSRGSNFAFLIFSQPGSFRFDFKNQMGTALIFPGVEQMVGDHAQVLSPPRLLWEKEYAAEG